MGFLEESQQQGWNRAEEQNSVKRSEGVFKRLWPVPKLKIRRKFLSTDREKIGVFLRNNSN